MLRSFFKELRIWREAMLRVIPGKTGEQLRRRFGKYECGARVRILPGVVIYHGEHLSIDEDSGIAMNCQINAKGGVEIGKNVLIGPGTFVWSQNHRFESMNQPIREQGYDCSPVKIEDGVWIAARCVILPGVTIAQGTVVAAGAVVTKSTHPYSIVAGVPARQIGTRKTEQPCCVGAGQ